MKIYILCGLIGSGKSTWAKEKAKDENTIIINRDALRFMIKGGKYTYHKNYESMIKDMASQCLNAAIYHGFDIIIDETNLTKDKRKYWVNLIDKLIAETLGTKKYTKIVVHFTESEYNLKYRMQDPKGLFEQEWALVLNGMKETYETPSADELKELQALILEI